MLISVLTACNSIKEYTGPKIVKITHTSIDYMGGYTVKHEIDFIENKYFSLGYWRVFRYKED